MNNLIRYVLTDYNMKQTTIHNIGGIAIQQLTRNIGRTERNDIFVDGDAGTKIFAPNGDGAKKKTAE